MPKYEVQRFFNKVEIYIIEAESIEEAKKEFDQDYDIEPDDIVEQFDFEMIEELKADN